MIPDEGGYQVMGAENTLARLARRGAETLAREDSVLYDLIEAEIRRQSETLTLVASSSIADLSALVCEGSPVVNVTAEGYPGRRFHSGCRIVDEIERLAIDRAKEVFDAQYANLQPHCASTANEIVLFGLLHPGDTIMGMDLSSGGHLTHGASVSISGRCFNAVTYSVEPDGYIDLNGVAEIARRARPRLIMCGATAYPKWIDFKGFRRIADEVGAYLVADITHVAGLVAARLHPNPIDDAHITTTCTHKQLYGPRGGLILSGKDHSTTGKDGKRTLAETIQSSVFPLMQGAPFQHTIAAKARALGRLKAPEFRALAERIVQDAQVLASELMARGYNVVSGGTKNHIVLVDLSAQSLTGTIAERALEECSITVNRNKVPGDRRSAMITSGIRIGTNTVAARSMGLPEMKLCASLIDRVLKAVTAMSESEYTLDAATRSAVRDDVRKLCQRFPIEMYL